MPATRTRRRSTKAVEPEEIEDDLEELEPDAEELEDDEPEPAPKRRGRPAKAAPAAAKPARKTAKAEEKAESFGTAWLVEYVNDQLDTEHDAKSLRVLLRKATEAGILERDDNSRYQFSGEDDRQVAKILKFVREQEKEAPAEKPAGAKAATKTAPAKRRRAAADEDDEAQAAPTRRRRSSKAKAAPVEDDDPDMPDFDDEEMDEL